MIISDSKKLLTYVNYKNYLTLTIAFFAFYSKTFSVTITFQQILIKEIVLFVFNEKKKIFLIMKN